MLELYMAGDWQTIAHPADLGSAIAAAKANGDGLYCYCADDDGGGINIEIRVTDGTVTVS